MNYRITFNCPQARVLRVLKSLALLRCIRGQFTLWVTIPTQQNTLFWCLVDEYETELGLDVTPWDLHNSR